MDAASKGTLEDEFGTSRDEEVVQQILEKGSVVESEVRYDFYNTATSKRKYHLTLICRTLPGAGTRTSRTVLA